MLKNLLVIVCFIMQLNFTFAQNGTITGRVLDEQKLALPGATIIVTNLENVGAISDKEGYFRIFNVPEGDHDLKISYIGYQLQTSKVSVQSGKTSVVSYELKEGVTVGEEIVILGDRLKGQAKALNQQMTNVNVTNVVAADQIGRFPDANIGDAMKRIPGITMQNDQGEARNIIIRGLAPQLNSVTLNGERIPSAEGGNRNVQMDLIPSDMIQTIEVNKAVTPDMDGDAIGGSVNLVTRSAPNGLRISATAASGYNLLSKKPTWTGGLVLGNRFADGKLGVVLSGSYNNNKFGSDNIEFEWEDGDVNPYVGEMDIRTYEVQRVRRSVSATFDYKINNNHTLFLRGMYNHRDDWENRFRTRYRNIDEPGEDGITTLEIRRQTKGGINNNRVDNRRLEDQRVRNLSLSGDHLFGKLKLDWSATYAKASEERPNERYIRFESSDAFQAQMDLSDTEFPKISLLRPNDGASSNFVYDESLEENQLTEERDYATKFDFQLPLSDDQNSILKFGVRYRDKEKFRNNSFTEYKFINDDFTLADVNNIDASKSDFLAGSEYAAGIFASPEYLGNLDFYNTSLFEAEDKIDEYLAGNYIAKEKISAAYVMVTQNINSKLTLIAGLRVENTDLEYTGYQVVLDQDGDPDPAATQSITNTDKYTNVLPGVHLKYNAKDNLIFRFAWTNTIGRPNYYDLVPFRAVNNEDNELAVGNPELNPTTSMNFDLMAENYFESIGLVSAGVFVKKVDDFIFTSVQQDYIDPFSGNVFDKYFRPANGSEATITGVEVAFQHQFRFLPGLGIYTNYTFTNSSASGIKNEDGELREDLDLPGTAKHMVNLSLSYETKKFVGRVSLNHSSDYLDEVGDGTFSDRYYGKQTFVDLNASYAFTNKLRVFVEANNLTNQPLRYYQGVESRSMQVEYYNARFNFGLKFDLTK